MSDFIDDIKDEFAVDSNPMSGIVFDALTELLGDDEDGIYAGMMDAESDGLLDSYDEDEDLEF